MCRYTYKQTSAVSARYVARIRAVLGVQDQHSAVHGLREHAGYQRSGRESLEVGASGGRSKEARKMSDTLGIRCQNALNKEVRQAETIRVREVSSGCF